MAQHGWTPQVGAATHPKVKPNQTNLQNVSTMLLSRTFQGAELELNSLMVTLIGRKDSTCSGNHSAPQSSQRTSSWIRDLI